MFCLEGLSLFKRISRNNLRLKKTESNLQEEFAKGDDETFFLLAQIRKNYDHLDYFGVVQANIENKSPWRRLSGAILNFFALQTFECDTSDGKESRCPFLLFLLVSEYLLVFIMQTDTRHKKYISNTRLYLNK